MLISELEQTDVAILGAGREGNSALRWLRRQFPGKSLTVYDEAAQSDETDTEVRWVNGALDAEQLCRHELLIRSPGISPYRPALQSALAAGTRCTTASSLWFAAHPEANTVCLTGTKGKSTTAALTAHLMESAGFSVQLAGNIGRPLLDCPDEVVDWWVIELSSYQLADLEASPGIAVILNVSDEHLDWHVDASTYRRDKLRLAALNPDAPLVLNHEDALLRHEFADRKHVTWFGRSGGWHVQGGQLFNGAGRAQPVPRDALPGAHNLENLAASLSILQAADLRAPDLPHALDGFRGLPHRLQRLGVAAGVEYVNDSLSTTPVATLAALEAFRDRSVILLLGGLDRGLDWSESLARMQALCPEAVICLPDSGPQIAEAMQRAGLRPERGVHVVEGLQEGMRQASELARPGDLVLLSPGAPSFPRFRDYAERGRRFAELSGLGLPDTE